MTNKTELVALVGFSAAGKTTLSKAIESQCQYTRLDHQAIVHELAVQHGYPRAREWLRIVGREQFALQSVQKIINLIIAKEQLNENRLIIDVGYNTEMFAQLMRSVPNLSIIIIKILADEATRIRNIQSRMPNVSAQEALEELKFRDQFLQEVGVQKLLDQTEAFVENNATIEVAVAKLRQIIKS